MPKKHPKPEGIVRKLRQVEVHVGQGMKQFFGEAALSGDWWGRFSFV